MAVLDIDPAEEAIVRNILAQHVPAGIAVSVFGSRATGRRGAIPTSIWHFRGMAPCRRRCWPI